ncbi:hypothetical protein [Pseudomonas aeruginosa]
MDFTYGYSQSDYRTRNEASGFPFKLDGDSRSHSSAPNACCTATV